MGSILIKLNPEKLVNPDLDLRYTIPDKIIEMMDGKVSDDGYDYLDDDVNSIGIFLNSDNAKVDVVAVLEILKSNLFQNNNIYDTAEISICETNDCDLSKYEIVHKP